MSSLLVHLVFIGLVIAITLLNTGTLSWHPLQLIYYIFAMVYLLLGLAWIIASVQVFFRDVSQVVAIFTQIGFWGTPIVWSLDSLPERFRFFVKLNPLYYLIEGYRKSLVYNQGFWQEESWLHLYFWCFSTVCFVVGVVVYKKLKPFFADVL